MAQQINRYGRQIFLSRREIEFLRGLVEREQATIQEKCDLEIVHSLLGEENVDNNGKLWYYVDASEANL